MLPALLHTLSFVICICVQSMATPLAGTWLPFHVAGCVISLYNKKYPPEKGLVWYAALAWMIALALSTFLFASVANGAAFMWILIAPPSLALCLHKEQIPLYLKCFGGVIAVYALGLIAQEVLQVQYDTYNFKDRRAWPLMDANNASALLNLALVPALWMTYFKDIRWGLLAMLLAAAMLLTGSKAGICAALGCFALILIYRYGLEMLALLLFFGAIAAVLIFYNRPEIIVQFYWSIFEDRMPIWTAAWGLLAARPWLGLGLGTFGGYYAQVRTEHYTAGFYAHNDLLQLAIEMGLPLAAAFAALILAVMLKTCRENQAAALAMLAVFLQAMVEFQFYVPALSYPLGLALGYHIIHRRLSRQSLTAGVWRAPPRPRR